MLSENPYDTFFSKMGYIFIKFGSEWRYTAICDPNISTVLQVTPSPFFLSPFLKKVCLSADQLTVVKRFTNRPQKTV